MIKLTVKNIKCISVEEHNGKTFRYTVYIVHPYLMETREYCANYYDKHLQTKCVIDTESYDINLLPAMVLEFLDTHEWELIYNEHGWRHWTVR